MVYIRVQQRKTMLDLGDWILTDEHILFIKRENPPLLEAIMCWNDEDWKEKMNYEKRHSIRDYFSKIGMRNVIVKVKSDSVGYKERGKIVWANKKDIFMFFRFEYEIYCWRSTKKLGNRVRLSNNPYPQYPTHLAKKNAEFLYLSTVGKDPHKIYRVKKKYDSIDEVNTPLFGDMPYEEDGYRYYALNTNEWSNKATSIKIFRTRDDYFPYPFLTMPDIFPSFLTNPCDKGSIKVSI